MNQAVLSMLARYKSVSLQDYENALKEIMQEIALLGLWRSKFFEHAAFYGGTALRILYGLDRFSEDLDFSLLQPQSDFRLTPYLNAVQAELVAMGFTVTVQESEKATRTAVESAFIKGGTKEHLIKITVPGSVADGIPNNQLLKVKFEVDTDPPGGFNTEAKTLLQPIPFAVHTYTQPDLFAGKLHAVIHRQWKGRVKGRDYYDLVWYVGRNIPVHLSHLEQRLRQSGGWTAKRPMKESDLHDLLKAKFADLDIAAARKEVAPFVRDPAALDIWSREFFESLLPLLKVE
jgi:predicted nucleotidyltransferase component of viral defense system